MNVLSRIQIKQVAYHFQFDKGLLTYFQGVAWPLKQACLEVVSSEGDQGLVNSKTVSVTTSPFNLTPRWDNCSGHLSSTVLIHHGMFVIKGLVASGTFILVKHPIFCFF